MTEKSEDDMTGDPWAAETDRVGEPPPEPRPEERRGDDPLGSVAEEAMKLFEAVRERAVREVGRGLLKGTADGFGRALGGGRDVWQEAVADHDEYICRACPICRVIAAQRESGASVADHLAAAGGELFAALRQAVDALTRPPRRPREDRPEAEHIDLG